MRRIGHWTLDYVSMLKGRWNMYLYKQPPKHYLEYVKEEKQPIILIQGVSAKWGMLKTVGDAISKTGHPVYIVPKIGHHLKDIPLTASLVREVIDENKLKNVILVSHSKGGLVAKYLLVHLNQDKHIKKVIAISAPFSGTTLAKMIPHSSHRELEPNNELFKDLQLHSEVNKQIISIFPSFDNHVLDKSRCILDGATNIEVNIPGHHRLLFNKKIIKTIIEQLN